jgi:hypothetical protein
LEFQFRFKTGAQSDETNKLETRNSKLETSSGLLANGTKTLPRQVAVRGDHRAGSLSVWSWSICASAIIAQKENGSQFYYVVKQGMWTGIGLVAMFITMHIDYRWLRNRRIVYPLLIITGLMLLAVFGFPRINGAHRWIKLSRFSIQPRKLPKGNLAIFLAAFLEKRAGEKGSLLKTFLPAAFITGVLALLVVAEPDLGTGLMLAVIFVTVIYTAGARLLHLSIRSAGASRALRPPDPRSLALHATPGIVRRSVGRRAGRGLSDSAIADRCRIGWHARAWFCAGQTEIFLSAVSLL